MKKKIAVLLSPLVVTGALAGCAGDNSNNSGDALSENSSSVSENTSDEQTNIDKALALIHTFADGDTETARDLLDENYIQHNLAYGTGEDAFNDSVESLASADVPTTVENVRAFTQLVDI